MLFWLVTSDAIPRGWGRVVLRRQDQTLSSFVSGWKMFDVLTLQRLWESAEPLFRFCAWKILILGFVWWESGNGLCSSTARLSDISGLLFYSFINENGIWVYPNIPPCWPCFDHLVGIVYRYFLTLRCYRTPWGGGVWISPGNLIPAATIHSLSNSSTLSCFLPV